MQESKQEVTKVVSLVINDRKSTKCMQLPSLAPDPFFIFLFFLFLLFFFFFLRGHNTCIACRILAYFSPLAFVQP